MSFISPLISSVIARVYFPHISLRAPCIFSPKSSMRSGLVVGLKGGSVSLSSSSVNKLSAASLSSSSSCVAPLFSSVCACVSNKLCGPSNKLCCISNRFSCNSSRVLPILAFLLYLAILRLTNAVKSAIISLP